MILRAFAGTLAFITLNACASNLDQCFVSAAEQHDVDPNLTRAIAYVESRFKANAVAYPPDGTISIGVMQVNTVNEKILTQRGLKIEDLYKPCVNIFIGTYILKEFIKTHGATWRAVGSYYVGNRRGTIPDSNRREYVAKVMSAYQRMTGTKFEKPVLQNQEDPPQKIASMKVIE